jgi:hypothetical protein
MPRPTMHDVHLQAALSQISIGYRNESYIADQVFPIVPVAKQSDYYFIFNKGQWFRDIAAKRSPGTRAQRADYSITTASYICLNYALAKQVPDEVRENADNPLRPDVEATEFVTDALMRSYENRVATIITTCANWASASTPGTVWSSDTSDPLGDIDIAVDAVIKLTGRMPNTGIMSWGVWKELKNHPDLLDRVKYTRPGAQPQPGDLAGWFGLDKVLVSHALVDSSVEDATSSLAYIWGSMFWVGYVAPNAALMVPSAGYTLEWMNRETRRFREDQERADVIEVSEWRDEVITASDAGGGFYGVV